MGSPFCTLDFGIRKDDSWEFEKLIASPPHTFTCIYLGWTCFRRERFPSYMCMYIFSNKRENGGIRNWKRQTAHVSQVEIQEGRRLLFRLRDFAIPLLKMTFLSAYTCTLCTDQIPSPQLNEAKSWKREKERK